MAQSHKVSGIPNIVLIGTPTQAGLERIRQKLVAHDIEHVCWNEPDFDVGFTSISTIPLTADQRAPLSNYCLWRPNQFTETSRVCSSTAERAATPVAAKSGVRLPANPPNSSSASSSEKEHPLKRGEVGGSIPSWRTRFQHGAGRSHGRIVRDYVPHFNAP